MRLVAALSVLRTNPPCSASVALYTTSPVVSNFDSVAIRTVQKYAVRSLQRTENLVFCTYCAFLAVLSIAQSVCLAMLGSTCEAQCGESLTATKSMVQLSAARAAKSIRLRCLHWLSVAP